MMLPSGMGHEGDGEILQVGDRVIISWTPRRLGHQTNLYTVRAGIGQAAPPRLKIGHGAIGTPSSPIRLKI